MKREWNLWWRVITRVNATQQPPAPESQPELPGMAAQFAAVGVESLPLGVAALSRRQRTWLLEYLRTGNATEAARRADYSSPESDGAKVRKSAGVAACLAQAGVQVAKSVDQLVMRSSERSRSLHAIVKEEMEKPADLRNEARIQRFTRLAQFEDSLLGSLLGKISGVHVTGDVKHSHQHVGEVALTVPESALPVLARIRREVVESQVAADARAMTMGGRS